MLNSCLMIKASIYRLITTSCLYLMIFIAIVQHQSIIALTLVDGHYPFVMTALHDFTSVMTHLSLIQQGI